MLPVPQGFFTEVTPIGLLLLILGLLIYFLMSGKLRTNRAVQELRADRDARVAEYRQTANDFKEALRISEKARAVQTEITREALEASRIQEDIVRSLRVALEIARKDMMR